MSSFPRCCRWPRSHPTGRGQHVRWLVNKGREFERLVAHPRVVPYFEHLLGPDYTLSTLTSNLIYPGAADGVGFSIRWRDLARDGVE